VDKHPLYLCLVGVHTPKGYGSFLFSGHICMSG
jgi:hypothetical protein